MKFPLRLSLLRNADGRQVIIDADGRRLFEVGPDAEEHVERVLLSINALSKVPLGAIRALYPRANWPANVEGADREPATRS